MELLLHGGRGLDNCKTDRGFALDERLAGVRHGESELDEDLHSITDKEDGLVGDWGVDVVVRQSALVFELHAGEDQALLIERF